MIDYNALVNELANYEKAGVYINDIIRDPDPILLKRGETDAVFNDLLADEQVTMSVMARKNRVLLSKKYTFRAGSPEGEKPTPEAEALKNAFVKDLENTNMTDVISAMLDAPFWGFSAIEVIWKGGSSLWHIRDLRPRPAEWFRFNENGQLSFVGERQITGDPVPFGKFILARHYPTYKNPYGIRLLSRCLWPVIFKKGGVKFYSYFAERYGLPFIHGTAADQASDEDLAKGAAQLSALRAGGAAMTPFGTTVQLLSAGALGTDIYERYLNRWDAAISKVIMGQTLTAELSGDTGSYAASETHMEVAGDIAESDRMIVTQTMNELAWIYAKINAPNIAAPVFEYEMPKDLSAKADLDGKLYNIGVEFTAEYVEKNYGIDKTLFNIVPKAQMGQPGGTPFGFAAVGGTELEPKDTFIEKLSAATGISADKLAEAKDLFALEELLYDAKVDAKTIEELIESAALYGYGSGLSG